MANNNPADGKKKIVLVAGILGVLILAAVAYVMFFSGGGSENTTATGPSDGGLMPGKGTPPSGPGKPPGANTGFAPPQGAQANGAEEPVEMPKAVAGQKVQSKTEAELGGPAQTAVRRVVATNSRKDPFALLPVEVASDKRVAQVACFPRLAAIL